MAAVRVVDAVTARHRPIGVAVVEVIEATLGFSWAPVALLLIAGGVRRMDR